MWARIYLGLVLVRLYFAFSPSYIHPDENFQGPEVIAGNTFGFPHHLTWEFSSSEPVRSVFPLWPVYGLPMVILRWLWTETGKEEVAPKVVYYTLRVVMFTASFVLEDWAIHELVHSPRQRRVALILVASSYVTWTYQTHTFSNSIETITVLWSIVLIQRIVEGRRSSIFVSGLLGFLVVFGIFNRITFPVFLIAPGIYLIPHFFRKPFTLLTLLLSAVLTTLLAIHTDAHFYHQNTFLTTLRTLFSTPLSVMTPYNLLIYNVSRTNLSLHGLHPYYTHLLINLPLLLGPSLILLVTRPLMSSHLASALLSLALLSLIPHQEARFLLPCLPLLLSSVQLPLCPRHTRVFITAWIIFNAAMGLLFGVFHQGGVVGMQIWLGENAQAVGLAGTEVLWWRTYSPPIWLLDGMAGKDGVQTQDLMGLPYADLRTLIDSKVSVCGRGILSVNAKAHDVNTAQVVLVVPSSSLELEDARKGEEQEWGWELIWVERRHFNLDDLEIGTDGVWDSLRRVVGRRGLEAWKVRRRCS